MAHHPRRREAGFTLVELMVVVAIVGALSTIAIPTMQRLTLRTKAAERPLVMGRLKTAVQDFYVQTGSAVPGGMGGIIVSNPNPLLPPTMEKRMMATNDPAWNSYFSGPGGASTLHQEIQGAVYYSYQFAVIEVPGTAMMMVASWGDLDGDGAWSQKTIWWTRQNGIFQVTSETPAAGQEDAATF